MNNQIEHKIPNETVLRQKIAESWEATQEEVVKSVGSLEAEYKYVKKRQRIAVMCFGVVAVLFGAADAFRESGGVISGLFGDVIGMILFFPFVIVLGIVGWWFARDKNNVVRRFNMGINKVLFPKVIASFELSGSYIVPSLNGNLKKAVGDQRDTLSQSLNELLMKSNSSEALEMLSPEIKQVTELLNHSELVTEPHNRTVIDDMMHIPWKDGEDGTLFIAELDLKHVTGSGKNRKVKNIFSGYFVSFDLERPLEGKTFVSTEGDTKGFGHQSFWNGVTGGEKLEVTELEWNDFENLLHVATTDPTEARYILTTNFMSDLYDWWKDKKRNIRIAFIGSRMYVLFPDKGIRFNKTVPSLDTSELQDYAMTIARPLMHVLHLVEDVKV